LYRTGVSAQSSNGALGSVEAVDRVTAENAAPTRIGPLLAELQMRVNDALQLVPHSL
jgi:hypothetical protein